MLNALALSSLNKKQAESILSLLFVWAQRLPARNHASFLSVNRPLASDTVLHRKNHRRAIVAYGLHRECCADQLGALVHPGQTKVTAGNGLLDRIPTG